MMKRCSQCVMPLSNSQVKLNKQGICNFCLEYKPHVLKGEESFLCVAKKYKKNGNKYDCIVPLSGGRESCYILYVIKAIYGLNPLAVNYDNEFVSEYAYENMEKAVNILNVDFLTKRSKKELRTKIVADTIKLNLKKGRENIYSQLCTHCWIGQESTVYMAAEKYQVPLIIWGDSVDEKTTNWPKVQKNKKDTKHRLLNIPIKNIKEVIRLKINSYRFNQEFCYGPKSVHPSISPGFLHFFDYFEHDEDKIINTIREKLDWKSPPELILPWRFDCLIGQIINFASMKMYGYSKFDFALSHMIRKGKISREIALEVLNRQKIPSFKQYAYIFKAMGLSEAEIDSISYD